jgi:sugar/nucleoside kinase (ribokinase family)
VPERARIVVFGDVIDDIVVVPTSTIRVDTDTVSIIRSAAGGSAANAACWMGSFGAEVDFVGRVALDDVARHGRLLGSAGVTPHLRGDEDLPTGTIVIIVDGDARTMLTSTGANALLSPDDVSDELLDAAALLHFTGYSLFGRVDDTAIRRLIERCAKRGVQVSVDPGSAGFLADFGARRFLDAVWGASMIFPNREEGRALTGLDDPESIVQHLLEGFRMVALTLDTGGVLVAARGRPSVQIPSLVVERVDPTGAGDAFAAGFLANWVVSGDDLTAAHAGVAAGATAVAQLGARPPVAAKV